MRKKLTVLLLTFVLFLSAALLGCATVFRVDSVAVEASVVSDFAREDALRLQGVLTELYKDDSTVFADDEEVKTALKDFPYLRYSGFEKKYPGKIVVRVTEDVESYAVASSENGYYIINADGIVMEQRESALNRLDGEPLVVIEGFEVFGEKGKKLNAGENFNALLVFCEQMSTHLDGIRDNVIKIEVAEYGSQHTQYTIQMREGVTICVGDPVTLTKDKADKAMEIYLSLSDEERMCGSIVVSDKGGNVVAIYDKQGLSM